VLVAFTANWLPNWRNCVAESSPVMARLMTGDDSATQFLQFGNQFAVNATKTAVTHDHNMAGLRQLFHRPGNQGLHRFFNGMVVQRAVLGTPAVDQFRQPAHITEIAPKYTVDRQSVG